MEKTSGLERWVRIIEWTLTCSITLAIIFFHVSFAHHAGGLWRDEINSVRLAQDTSWQALKADMQFDTFPALFTFVLKGWIAMSGPSIQSLRTYGLGIGVCTLIVLWLAVWRLVRRPALLAVIPFSFLGVSYLFGDAVRPHGLGLLFLVVMAWQTAEYLMRGHRWALGLALLAAVAAVQTEYAHLIVVLSITFASGISLLAEHRVRETVRVWGVLGVIPVLSLIPWAWHVQAVGSWWYLVSDRTHSASLSSQMSAAVLGLAFIGAMAFIVIRYVHSRLARFFIILMLTATVSLSLFLVITAARVQTHYLLPIIVLGGLSGQILFSVFLSQTQAFIAAVVISVPFVSMNITGTLFTISMPVSSMPDAASVVQKQASENDLVIVAPWYGGVSYSWYADSRIRWQTLPPLPSSRLHYFRSVAEVVARPADLEKMVGDIHTTLQQGHAVWLLSSLRDPHQLSAISFGEIINNPFPKTRSQQYAVWYIRVVRELETHAQYIRLVSGLPTLAPDSVEKITAISYSDWR